MIKTCLVAATMSSLLISAATASDAAPGACHVHGEVIQWIADYCLAKMQTDDEIAVSDCIADNHVTAFPSECAAKINYKKALCGLLATSANSADIESCVLDPTVMGRTVRQGGVGG